MKTYTINEAIEDIASTIQVFSDGYGTWKVKANLGLRSTGEYAEDYFTTHDEEWKTGEFDGERFNPQDYDEWLESYFEPEFNGVSKDALALITDEMKNKMFEAWCERLWSDSANEDNYESPNARDRRAAKKIVENWVDENNWPNKIVVTADNSKIFLLDSEESKFADDNTDALAMLIDGRSKAFLDAFDNREESDV